MSETEDSAQESFYSAEGPPQEENESKQSSPYDLSIFKVGCSALYLGGHCNTSSRSECCVRLHKQKEWLQHLQTKQTFKRNTFWI